NLPSPSSKTFDWWGGGAAGVPFGKGVEKHCRASRKCLFALPAFNEASRIISAVKASYLMALKQ
ncbi:hypothetical protein, partial [uncultured Bilophila sp.]